MEWKRLIVNTLGLRAGLVILLAVFAIVFGALPLKRRIAEENDDIQKAVVRMEHAREKVSRIGEYRSQYGKISEYGRETDLVLSEGGFASFISELELIARETGGDIVVSQGSGLEELKGQGKKETSPKEDEGARLVDEMSGERALSLSVRFRGSYPQAVDFLHRMETLPYFLDVLSVDFSAHTEEVSDAMKPAGGVFAVSDTVSEDVPPSSAQFTEADFDFILYLE